MRKNVLFFIFTILFMTISPANAAKSVKVTALTEFNSITPTDKMKVVVVERAEFKNGIIFEDGTILDGEIFDVKQPKRAKRNASFKFRPITYTYNGKTQKITDPEFIAKYAQYKELDKGAIVTTAATTAGGMIFHIPLLSESVSLVKGMYKNEEDNRLKSGVVQVYKDSPLSYIEEGSDISIKKDTLFILKFKSSDEEDLDTTEEDITQDKNISESTKDENVHPVKINSTEILQEEEEEEEEEKEEKVNNIKTTHPDEILKEVESNTK